MIGQKFGKWLVVSYSHRNSQYQYFWHCKCECGTERVIEKAQLKNGHATQCKNCFNTSKRKYKPVAQGDTYGKWRVLKEDDEDKRYVHVECECGNIKKVIKSSLSQSQSTKCTSCARREGATKHGHSSNKKPSPEYQAWCNMKNRCYNKKVDQYPNYGGRGIRVHEHWLNSFDTFIKDVGMKPSPKHSLERIDVNSHYEPGNVTWALSKEQVTNRRVSFKYYGTYIDIKALSKEVKSKPKTIKLLLEIATPDQIRAYGKLDHYQKSMFGMIRKNNPLLTFDQIISKILITPLVRQKRAPLFSLWRSMIRRCTNPKDKDFPNYGGKGVQVCNEWKTYEGFVNSLTAAIGSRPSLKHSLDRIDPNKNYTLANVRWATSSTQAKNKRQGLKISGIGVSAKELSKKYSLRSEAVVQLIRLGYDELAIASYAKLSFGEKKRLAIFKKPSLKSCSSRPTSLHIKKAE